MTRGGRLPRLMLAGLAALSLAVAGCTRSAAMPAPPLTKGPGAQAAPVPAVAASAATVTPASAVETRVVEPKLVYSGDRKSRKVALTFDLCEVPGNPSGFDRGLVDVLLERRVPATFLMGGHWAETHAAEAALLGSTDFFEIGNHSYAHKHPTRLSDDAFREEISLAQASITKAAGVTPAVFRFAYGEHDERTLRLVAETGLVPVQWDVVSGDPDKNISAKEILGEVKRQTRNGSIVIMHANGRGWHTAEALPAVIDWLRGQGYELVTVSELVAPAP